MGRIEGIKKKKLKKKRKKKCERKKINSYKIHAVHFLQPLSYIYYD